MTPVQRIERVIAEMRAHHVGYPGPVYTATQGDVARWLDLLTGERERRWDACGGHQPECVACGRTVDTFYLPKPEYLFCERCALRPPCSTSARRDSDG